jgi:hypothetical protein
VVDWRNVLWTLWLLAALFLAAAVMILARTGSTTITPRIFVVLFTLGWLYLLLTQRRRIWIATIALFAISLAVSLVTLAFDGSASLYGLVAGLVEFALLLMPVTRRFYARPTMPSGRPEAADYA